MPAYRRADIIKVGDTVYPGIYTSAGSVHLPPGTVGIISSGQNRRGMKLLIFDLDDGRTFIHRPDERVYCEPQQPEPPAHT